MASAKAISPSEALVLEAGSTLPQPSRRESWVVLALITAIAGVLAFYSIGSKSFWLDEATSYWRAREPWDDFVRSVLGRDPSMPLYYLFLRAWIRMGDSEAALRSLSALFGVASVVGVYHLGSSLFDRLTGLVAAALLAANPFLLQYEQEARGYAQSLFFSTASCYLFARALQSRSRGMWVGWIATSALGVATHAFVLLVIAAQIASLIALRREPKDSPSSTSRRRLIVGALLLTLVAAAVGLTLAPNVSRAFRGGLPFIPDPSPGLLINFFQRVAGMGLIALALPLFFWLVAVTHSIRTFRREGRSWHSWAFVFALLLLVLPVVIAYLFSFLRPVFVARYLIVVLPGLVLVTAVGVTRVRARWQFWSAIALLVILPTGAANAWFEHAQKEEWRSLTAHVVTHDRPDDAFFFFGPSGARPFTYYAGRSRGAVDGHMTYPTLEWVRTDGGQTPIVHPVPAIAETARRHDRVWLILSFDAIANPGPLVVLNAIKETHEEESLKRWHGISTILFTRRGVPNEGEAVSPRASHEAGSS